MTVTPMSTARGQALTFDDLGTPLVSTTFVVVDLETTGGSAKNCEITEIGAVKATGGVVEGEFQTLVNPGVPIPPFIASLTGITTHAVLDAPTLATALPAFLDFAAGSVLVAHNAGFDISFLKAACRKLAYEWPGFPVVDTARLARVLMHEGEVPNKKLASLAHFFRSSTEPNHRALSDARATVDVLHGLIERAGSFGAHHQHDLHQLTSRITPAQRKKRTLADGLPDSAGIYIFWDRAHSPLYVGKSKSIRSRVRTYFTAGEKRKRINEMVRIAHEVTAIPCATDLEAQVREVRLIAKHKPPYNRRSKRPEKVAYLKLTEEPFPRLSISATAPTTKQAQSGTVIGPFSGRKSAQQAKSAMEAAFPIRTCTTKLSRKKLTHSCIAAELGACLAPCDKESNWFAYEAIMTKVALTFGSKVDELHDTLVAQMQSLARSENFEAAASLRDQLRSALTGIAKATDFGFLQATPLLVAASPNQPNWDLHVIKFGRLAGASLLDPGVPAADHVQAALDCAAAVTPPERGTAAEIPEEAALVLKWLLQPGVRLARIEGEFASPIESAHKYLAELPKVDRVIYKPHSATEQGLTKTHAVRQRIQITNT
jgi:DNA polymerase-3 subunit epsilon